MDLVSWFLVWSVGGFVGQNKNGTSRSSYSGGGGCLTPGPEPLDYPGFGSIKALLFTNYTFPKNGRLIGFKWYNKRPDIVFYASVYRKVAEKKYELRFKTELKSDQVGLAQDMIKAKEAFRVDAGDFLGIHYQSAVSESTVPLAELGALCSQKNNQPFCLQKQDLYETHSVPLSDGNLVVGEIIGMDNVDGIVGKATTLRAPAINPIFCLERSTTSGSTSSKESGKKACVFPFSYQDETFVACTDRTSPGKYWCATDSHYSSDNWRLCDDDDQFIQKMPCHFPFTYDGVQYNSCIKANSMTFWCAVTDTFGPNTWRECTDEDTKPKDLSCHYPYMYDGVQRDMCIMDGAVKHWCAVSDRFGEDTWKNCDKNDRVPENMPCKFPFTAGGTTYNTCKVDRTGRPWCSVQAEFREDNWRFCRSGDVFPVREKCHFPFAYRGQFVSKCITDNSVSGWCSTTADYDSDKKWADCVTVDVIVKEGTSGPLTLDTAAALCESAGRKLATEYDITGAFENGLESCGCAVADDGKSYDLVRNEQCKSLGKAFGLQTCDDEDATKALCVKESE